MSYRVYSGAKGSEDISSLAKEQMLFKEVATEALAWARHVEHTGCVPLQIDGDDGTTHEPSRDRRRPAGGIARGGRRPAREA